MIVNFLSKILYYGSVGYLIWCGSVRVAGAAPENSKCLDKMRVNVERSEDTFQLSLSQDGSFLAAKKPGGLAVWRTDTGAMVESFGGTDLFGHFSTEGRSLVLNRKASLKVFAPPDFESPILEIPNQEEAVSGLPLDLGFSLAHIFANDSKLAFVRSKYFSGKEISESLIVTSIPSLQEESIFALGTRPDVQFALSADGKRLVLVSQRRDEFEIIDLPAGRKEFALPIERGALESEGEFGLRRFLSPGPVEFKLLPDGSSMVSVHTDFTIRTWDLKERAERFRMYESVVGGPGTVQLDPEDNWALVVMGSPAESAIEPRGNLRYLTVFNITTGQIVCREAGPFESIAGLGFAPATRTVAILTASDQDRSKAAIALYKLNPE